MYQEVVAPHGYLRMHRKVGVTAAQMLRGRIVVLIVLCFVATGAIQPVIKDGLEWSRVAIGDDNGKLDDSDESDSEEEDSKAHLIVPPEALVQKDVLREAVQYDESRQNDALRMLNSGMHGNTCAVVGLRCTEAAADGPEDRYFLVYAGGESRNQLFVSSIAAGYSIKNGVDRTGAGNIEATAAVFSFRTDILQVCSAKLEFGDKGWCFYYFR